MPIDILPPVTSPHYLPPDGPRWLPRLRVGDAQIDGRGTRWAVTRVEAGGRVVHWDSAGRRARTEAVSTHPEYPSDEAVAAWHRARWRAAGGGWV